MEGTKLQTEGRIKETLKGQETQEGMEIKNKKKYNTRHRIMITEHNTENMNLQS